MIAMLIRALVILLSSFLLAHSAGAMPRLSVDDNTLIVDADGGSVVAFHYQKKLWLAFWGERDVRVSENVPILETLSVEKGKGFLIDWGEKPYIIGALGKTAPTFMLLDEGIYIDSLPVMLLSSAEKNIHIAAFAGKNRIGEPLQRIGFKSGFAGMYQPIISGRITDQFLTFDRFDRSEKRILVPVVEPEPVLPTASFERAYEEMRAVRKIVEKKEQEGADAAKRPLRHLIQTTWDDVAPEARFEDDLPEATTELQQRALAVLLQEIPHDVDSRSNAAEKVSIFDVLDDSVSFPSMGEDDLENFVNFKYELYEELGHAVDMKQQDKYRRLLAQLHLAYGRAHEALMVLSRGAVNENGVLQDQKSRLVAGAANAFLGRETAAEKNLMTLVGRQDVGVDAALWQAVVHGLKKEDDAALVLFEEHISAAQTYPQPLLEYIYLSYARALLRYERLSDVKRVLQELSTYMPAEKLSGEGILILAKAHMIAREDALAENLLAQAAASPRKSIALRAQYEFVALLLKRGDLGINQAITHLENLRYLWRGDDIEENILMKLGRIYLLRGEQRKGLERLKEHGVYYPQTENSEIAASLMVDSFTRLYLEDDFLTQHNPLQILGIYYDFRELTPPGKKGDALIAEVSRRLKNLNLFERAAELLHYQLEYRVKNPQNRAAMGAEIALIYLLNDAYEDGLSILQKTQVDEVSAEILSQRRLINAELLMGLKRFEEARALLLPEKTHISQVLRAEIDWRQGAYDQVIDHLHPLFVERNMADSLWGSDEKVSFTQLAIAYNMTNRLRELEHLLRRYDEEISADQNLRNISEFLAVDRGAERAMDQNIDAATAQDNVWPKVTQAMDHYNQFTGFYQEFKRKRGQERDDKALFNRRMRQISAPPRL